MAALAFDMGDNADPAGIAFQFGAVKAVPGLGVIQVFAHVTGVSQGQLLSKLQTTQAFHGQYSCQELSKNG